MRLWRKRCLSYCQLSVHILAQVTIVPSRHSSTTRWVDLLVVSEHSKAQRKNIRARIAAMGWWTASKRERDCPFLLFAQPDPISWELLDERVNDGTKSHLKQIVQFGETSCIILLFHFFYFFCSPASLTYAHSQNLKNERYRFNLIVGELEKTTSLEYKVAILAFLNCLIISAKTSQARIRMRNEFIGEWKICPSIITINECHKVRLTREKWTCLCLLTNEVVL